MGVVLMSPRLQSQQLGEIQSSQDKLLHMHIVPGLPCVTVILGLLATPVQRPGC